MDRLTEMEAFASVVDLGGFTDAARKMGLSKSAVSKHVSSLEARLGARLLNRTTRRVSPTEIGLAYYDRARRVLVDASEADAMVTSMTSKPVGVLKIVAPSDFAICCLSPILERFLRENPQVSVDMELCSHDIATLPEGVDLGIQISSFDKTRYAARLLGAAQMRIIGAPSYFALYGKPERIEDLARHKLLHFSGQNRQNLWELTSRSGEMRQIRASGNLTVNDRQSLLQAAEAGLGIAYLPNYLCDDVVAQGRLEVVLDDLPQDRYEINVIYAPATYTQPKVRAFVEFLARQFEARAQST